MEHGSLQPQPNDHPVLRSSRNQFRRARNQWGSLGNQPPMDPASSRMSCTYIYLQCVLRRATHLHHQLRGCERWTPSRPTAIARCRWAARAESRGVALPHVSDHLPSTARRRLAPNGHHTRLCPTPFKAIVVFAHVAVGSLALCKASRDSL